ncbi:hypothetical protein HY949_00365 [Candidatus Gottesmanbacteria bacterium]|nr:hypothetical protein [Candidatus Gottesmanbacteria bacterium]
MIDVTPAVFVHDEASLVDTVQTLSAHSPWIQIDLSDGTMVPETTFFDIDKLAQLVKVNKSISFEAHLMVDNPVKYLKPLVDAGFKRVIAQVEASDPRRFLEEAELESIEVGLALDGSSEVETIEPFLETVDVVVIMTIEAGVADGPFLPESIEKIKAIRHHFPDLAIVAEGNIDQRNAKLLSDAGVSRLVISSDTLLKDPAILSQTLESLQGK